jgi:hypothetical protein
MSNKSGTTATQQFENVLLAARNYLNLRMIVQAEGGDAAVDAHGSSDAEAALAEYKAVLGAELDAAASAAVGLRKAVAAETARKPLAAAAEKKRIATLQQRKAELIAEIETNNNVIAGCLDAADLFQERLFDGRQREERE